MNFEHDERCEIDECIVCRDGYGVCNDMNQGEIVRNDEHRRGIEHIQQIH